MEFQGTPEAQAVAKLARALFATDPRVVAIVNRVTDTKGPTWEIERAERRAHPKLVTRWHDDPIVLSGLPTWTPPPGMVVVDIFGIEPKTPRRTKEDVRAARARAFGIAWRRERSIRHECLRRAVAIVRGEAAR